MNNRGNTQGTGGGKGKKAAPATKRLYGHTNIPEHTQLRRGASMLLNAARGCGAPLMIMVQIEALHRVIMAGSYMDCLRLVQPVKED